MKQLILIGLLIGCGIFAAEAQKAYKSGEMFVIECAGMPAGSYTKTAKPRTTDGTNSSSGSNTAINLSSEVNNKNVAYKFEVAAKDNSIRSLWQPAVELCAGLSGGNWRMPTQRELMLVFIEHEKLKTLAGFTPFSASSYWVATDATEKGGSTAWFTNFAMGGVVDSGSKATDNFFVRCIRDL